MIHFNKKTFLTAVLVGLGIAILPAITQAAQTSAPLSCQADLKYVYNNLIETCVPKDDTKWETHVADIKLAKKHFEELQPILMVSSTAKTTDDALLVLDYMRFDKTKLSKTLHLTDIISQYFPGRPKDFPKYPQQYISTYFFPGQRVVRFYSGDIKLLSKLQVASFKWVLDRTKDGRIQGVYVLLLLGKKDSSALHALQHLVVQTRQTTHG